MKPSASSLSASRRPLFRVGLLLIAALFVALPANGQPNYWVTFSDKQGATFNPYTYFDAQAIERYCQRGADLYDSTNYPLCDRYVAAVDAIVAADFGQSRWLNAVAVKATPAQIRQVASLPFVREVRLIESEVRPAWRDGDTAADGEQAAEKYYDQVLRMQGDLFEAYGIDGTGIRIAVFDAGFPQVDTHKAFKHLHDNHRIIDTWNFPCHKADVYGWNSHGRATLSCIAGIVDGKRLGMATGAEFLLYRTEVNLEPFAEEVWWAMAAERADQHGANIISSSLGYGKERHCPEEMDGRSYVAKAARLAARKGILVCNSAGNEGDDRKWKTIITPSDADSVLCVGGIVASPTRCSHIYFSSFGPSADGRLKPNVSAYGYAMVADRRDGVTSAYGTSFSCPLVAGFAACAWQASPGKTAMEMYEAIQQSASLYPYFDYAVGYGVPQASFFVGEKVKAEPSFVFEDSADCVCVRLLRGTEEPVNILYNKQRPDGGLERYASVLCQCGNPGVALVFPKQSIDSCRINVSYLGYTDVYALSPDDRERYQGEVRDFRPKEGRFARDFLSLDDISFKPYDKVEYDRTAADLKLSKSANWRWDFFLQWGGVVRTASAEHRPSSGCPRAIHLGVRVLRQVAKPYSLGLGLGWGVADNRFASGEANALDNMLQASYPGRVTEKTLWQGDVALELFQRVCLVPGGTKANGLYWDLGVYGAYSYYNYRVRTNTSQAEAIAVRSAQYNYRSPSFLDGYPFNWGVSTRVGYSLFAVYARYRLTGIGVPQVTTDVLEPGSFYLNLPRLEIGLQLMF